MQNMEIQSSVKHDSIELESEERPWGRWAVLSKGIGYKVKLLEILSGHRLSLQYHEHRNEHWVVITGKARVVIGDKTFELGLFQSATVPMMTIHRIENPYAHPVVILEVQQGDVLIEEDIIRIEDDYQRIQNDRRTKQ